MAITSYTQRPYGASTLVEVTSDLVGAVYYHWYLDGVWVGQTVVPERRFALEAGDQQRVEVVDTLDPDFDFEAGSPTGWPARRTISWVASQDATTRWYRVTQKKTGLADAVIALVPHRAEQWWYRVVTPRLADLGEYDWTVEALDAAGNASPVLSVDGGQVVRTPDAPAFAVAYAPPPPGE